MDGQFRPETKPTGDERYRTGNQPVDELAERHFSPEPVPPYSIQARHQKNRADRRASDLRGKPGPGEDRRQASAVKLVEMSGRIQLKPPAAEELELKTADIRNLDDQKAVILEKPVDPP